MAACIPHRNATLPLLTEYVKPFTNFPRLPTSSSSSWMTPLFFLISQTKWKSHDRSSSALLSVYKHTGTQVNCFLLPSCYNRGSIWFFNHPLVHCALAPVSSTFSRTLHYYYYPFSSVSSISPSQLGLSDWYLHVTYL